MRKSICLMTLLALLPATSHAACSVMARPGAQVMLDGTPLVGAKRLEPCKGELRVARGEAAACAIKAGGSPECKAVKEGGSLALASLAGKAGNDLTTRMVSVFNGLRGLETQEGGRKAFGEGVRHDLPVEEIAVPSGDLTITPNLAATGPLTRFQLTSEDKPAPVFKLAQINGAFTIPRKVLQAGATYAWRVSSARQGELSGEFYLMKADTAEKLQAEVQAALAQTDSEFARMLLAAMVYDEYGLAWDRDQMLNRARN